MCPNTEWIQIATALGSCLAGMGAIMSGIMAGKTHREETKRTERLFELERKRDETRASEHEEKRRNEMIRIFGELRHEHADWKRAFKSLKSLYPELKNEVFLRDIVKRLMARDFPNAETEELLKMLDQQKLL